MKKIKVLSLVIVLMLFSGGMTAQPDQGTIIPLKNISVYPADIAQPGSGIENIADGKRTSDAEIFHSLWNGILKQDVVVEAELEGAGKRLDLVNIAPRENGINGVIKNAELWIKSKGKYRKIADIQADEANDVIKIELNRPIFNPEKIKLIIHDAYGDEQNKTYFVSLGELSCVTLSEASITKQKLSDDAKVFSNLLGTKLKSGIKQKDIDQMKVPALQKLANQLFNQKYKSDSLSVSVQPLLHPDILGKNMRIGNGYSKLEGITGIVLDQGDNVVFVGKTNGLKVKLVIPDWTRKAPENIKPTEDPAGWGLKKEVFNLQEGVNLIHLSKCGHAYIQYFTESKPEKYAPVKVHFPTGKNNGYFDVTRGDTNADFDRLLSNAISPILDLRGKHIQVAFPVESLKKFAAGKGVELLQNYDSIVSLQQKMLGWYKEGFYPNNRILVRINYHYYMFRDEDGVAFIDWAMKLVADPKSVIKGDPCWGFSHEVGHIHQMRPQITWGGMTEVSNNILTMYSTTAFKNPSRLSEGKHYGGARNTILDKGISYMDFPGRINGNTNQYGGSGNTNVLERLVPFWQLHLYFKEAGKPDFYADLMIAMRKQAPLGGGDSDKNYLNMLEFCRLACEVSQTDLTEFFERWGFFYVGEIDVADYGNYLYQVTESDVDQVKRAIANMHLPKPTRDITLMED